MPLDAEARAERALWLRLILTPGIGPGAVRQLLERFGLPEDILDAGRNRLAEVLGAQRAAALLADDDTRDALIRATLQWASADGRHLVALHDPGYPQRLLQIGDPPPMLYVRGSIEELSRDSIAIVGSRHATRSGLENARAFARALADEGLQVCSGLARGIDAAAHRGALEGRCGTIAIVGTGIDRVYPAAHHTLADTITRKGAVVSELPLGTTVHRANFPRRNRLIAGASLGVLVVEAATQSGSLITARHAAEFGREVMAIPGSIHSPVSRGCHRLIREGAKLVESVDDVLVELRAQMVGGERAGVGSEGPGWAGAEPAPVDGDAAASLAGDAAALLQALGWDPAVPDTLAERTGLPPQDVAAALVELELGGHVERWIDGRYVRIGA